MAGDKTEKATPKRRSEARKKGQVAKSTDLQGAFVLLAGIIALGAFGAGIAERMGSVMRESLALIRSPRVVEVETIGGILLHFGESIALAVAPIAATCLVAAVVVSVAQVGFKPSVQALKPDAKRLNPIQGAKNIFGPNALVEALKSVSKVGIVGAIVAMALLPKLDELGALMGIEPAELGIRLAGDARSLMLRAAIAYLVIGAADVIWQRYRFEKSLKMDMQEIKDEHKEQSVPPEVRAAMRRRQAAAARARMMSAVPEADVVVTNPTHYAVALKYDSDHAAPIVVAKGKDLIALRIRELAREHDVAIMPDPPLARSLHATCEVGDEIPEDLYVAVAQVLAWVYRQRPRVTLAA